MNQTINMQGLIAKVSATMDCDKQTARRYVQQFFQLVQTILASGETVKIKGIGSFAPTGNADEPIEFKSDKQLAEQINSPFEIFQPMELPADVEIAGNDDDEVIAAPLNENEETVAPAAEVEGINESEEVVSTTEEDTSMPPAYEPPVYNPEPEQEQELQPEPVSETEPEPKSEVEETTDNQTDTEQIAMPYNYEEPKRRSNGSTVIIALITLILGICLGWIAYSYFGPTKTVTHPIKTTVHDTIYVKLADTVRVAPVEPDKPVASEPVYDTISANRFLTTMAREHFGQMEYWVFIYEANPGLGNPNRIGPGTKVRIPTPDEFVKPGETPEQTVSRAKNLALEIYSNY